MGHSEIMGKKNLESMRQAEMTENLCDMNLKRKAGKILRILLPFLSFSFIFRQSQTKTITSQQCAESVINFCLK